MTEQEKRQLMKIAKDLNKRMSGYHSSLEPTDDEVTIAWLLTIISELRATIDFPFMVMEEVKYG